MRAMTLTRAAASRQLAEQRFRIISEAYETLRDPVARERVDRSFYNL